MRVSVLCVALALIATPASAATRDAYHPKGTCDGWPRAPIEMAPGMCAGIVVTSRAELHAPRFPRMMLQTGAHEWLLTDMGGWVNGRGAVYRLHAEHAKAQLIRVLDGLSMPHTIARGPDGKIYVGEMSRVFRFNPDAPNPQATIEPVVIGLPDNRLHSYRHPLSAFIFDADGDILVNVGAPSDQCATSASAHQTTCEETEGPAQVGGVRRYAYLGNGKWSRDFTMFARGLRNSLAMVRHSSGTILQAENSIDFHDDHSPFEEINVLHAGAHYGWPYCFDMTKVTPVWAATHVDCRTKYTPPARLMPPHAAPLSMLYYDGAMFPQLRGRLLMTWHGYKPTGARIVAFAVDEKGLPVLTPNARYPEYNSTHVVTTRPYPGPASEPAILTPGWDRIPGTRPMGTPVGLAVAQDGAIWVTEDKNATILRIAVDRP